MNIQDAIDQLKPFSSRVPTEALDVIRSNWAEAEPLFIAELDAACKHPEEDDEDAVFIYSLYLCTDMRSYDAFERFIALCRLPNLILDQVLGDILTEDFPRMLQRTCAGREEYLKALIEDATVNEFARDVAMRACLYLVLEGELSPDALMDYCIQLLDRTLEKFPSYIWNAVSSVALDINPGKALHHIEKAYNRGLLDWSAGDWEWARNKQFVDPDLALEETRKMSREWISTEKHMGPWVRNWKGQENMNTGQKREDLLDILQKKQPAYYFPSEKTKTGRNEPCPCGSGKKFKKCCLLKAAPEEHASAWDRIHPDPAEDAVASAWMEAGYKYQDEGRAAHAYKCWEICWEVLRAELPLTLTTPDNAESSGAFVGYEYLDIWLEDFEALVCSLAPKQLFVARFGYIFFSDLLLQFPAMDADTIENYELLKIYMHGLMGFGEDALKATEEHLKTHPHSLRSPIALADMLTFGAEAMNIRPEPQRALTVLEAVFRKTDDGSELGVDQRIQSIRAICTEE